VINTNPDSNKTVPEHRGKRTCFSVIIFNKNSISMQQTHLITLVEKGNLSVNKEKSSVKQTP